MRVSISIRCPSVGQIYAWGYGLNDSSFVGGNAFWGRPFFTLLVSVTFIVERAFKGCTFFEKIFFCMNVLISISYQLEYLWLGGVSTDEGLPSNATDHSPHRWRPSIMVLLMWFEIFLSFPFSWLTLKNALGPRLDVAVNCGSNGPLPWPGQNSSTRMLLMIVVI